MKLAAASRRRNDIKLRFTGVADPTIPKLLKRPLTVDERLVLMFSTLECRLPKNVRRARPTTDRMRKIDNPSVNVNPLLINHHGTLDDVQPQSVDISLVQFWFSDTFLWYYALRYARKFGVELSHVKGCSTRKWANYSSRFSAMSDKFDMSPVEMKHYIDWLFDSREFDKQLATAYGRPLGCYNRLVGIQSSRFVDLFRSPEVQSAIQTQLPKKKIRISRSLVRKAS